VACCSEVAIIVSKSSLTEKLKSPTYQTYNRKIQAETKRLKSQEMLFMMNTKNQEILKKKM